MEFPRYVFKDRETKLIHQESEKPEGWFWDVLSALSAPSKPEEPPKPEEPVPSLPEPGLNAPPTREELEIRAKELNVKFHHKTGDKKLAELIEQAEQALGG